MPVEIRELVIRATVADTESSAGEQTASADESALVAECVEQVLEVLRRQKER